MVLSFLFAVAGQSAVTLRYQPPVGQTIRYQVAMNQSMSGGAQMTLRQDIEQTMRIVSRKGDRTTVEATINKIKVTLPPNSPMAGMKSMMEKGAGTKTTMVIDSRGRLVSTKAGGAMAGQAMMQGLAGGGMSGVELPAGAVRIGQSWTGKVDLGKMAKANGGATQGMQISGVLPTKTTLLGIKKVGNVTLAHLSFSMKGTMRMSGSGANITSAITASGNSWIEASTGIAREMKMTQESTTNFGGQSVKQKMTSTMRKL